MSDGSTALGRTYLRCFDPGGRRSTKCIHQGVVAVLAALASYVQAFEIDIGNPEVKIHWDNTTKYTVAWRLRSQSDTLANNPPSTINQDDADRNFNRAILSNRFDLFSELDVTYKNVGARVSG